MAEIKNSWLPEVYTKFLETSSLLQRWRVPHRIISITTIIAGGVAFFNPEYANYLYQPQVLLTEALAYIAAYPHANLPNFNIGGRRLHKQLYEEALGIFRTEGWETKGVSKNKTINRVNKVLDYTRDLAPVDSGFNPSLAPSERFYSFPKTEKQLGRLSNADRQVLRKALIFSESFWQEAPGYKAVEMVKGIKTHLAILSSVGYHSLF